MRLIAAAFAIAAVLPVAPALAQGDRWIVRGRAMAVVTDDDSETVGGTGSAIAVADSFAAEVAVTYLVRPNWGLELGVSSATLDLATIGGDAAGLEIGSVDLLAAMLAVQYRFGTEGRIDPYVGVGTVFGRLAGYSATTDMAAAGIADVTFSNIVRLFTQLGADLEVGKGWKLNLDLRYAPMTTRAAFVATTGSLFDTVSLQLNPALISVGVARSF